MLAAELHDLSLGQGEWRNMQQIIRKTFKLCLEKQHEQNQQITNLTMQVTKLKEDLNQRPTWADVENMVMLKSTHDKHLASFRSKQGGLTNPSSSASTTHEIEELRLQVAQLRSECERRVTIQSMQTALHRKADRADVQTLKESTNKVADTPQDLSRLKLDIAEVKSEIEYIQEQVEETKRGLAAKNTIVDLSVVKVQLEGLFRRVHEEMYNRDEISNLLNQKISRVDAEKLLSTKSDVQTISTVTTKIEDVLAEHERLITSLRLSVSDPSLFSADFLSKKGPLLPQTSTSSSGRHSGTSSNSDSDHAHLLSSPSRHTTSSSARKVSSSHSSSGTTQSAISRTGIQDSKLESILSGLWNKMNALIKEYKTIHAEHSQMRKDVSNMKEQLQKVAAVEKMELLAVVVEEQRLRLDSVIQGSTKIFPIFKELKRMDATIKEVDAFLSLPQPRRLHDHLQQMTSLMEDLSQRLVELSADVHTQQANKVDTLMSRTDAIEARVESCLVDRERIGYLMEQVDTSDTRYGNLREISEGLTQLWNLLLNDQQSAATQSIVTRVKSIETQLRDNHDEHTSLQHRIDLLKDAFASYGLQIEQYEQEQRKDRHRPRRNSRDQQSKKRSNSEDSTPYLSESHMAEPRKRKVEEEQRMHISEFENPEVQEEVNDKESTIHRVDEHSHRQSNRGTKDKRDTSHQKDRQMKRDQDQLAHRQPTVDFDAAISALYASLEDVTMPVRVPVASPLRHRMMGIGGHANHAPTTSRNRSEPVLSSSSTASSPSESPVQSPAHTSEVMLMSITEVDERLAELQREKQRLCQLLIHRV